MHQELLKAIAANEWQENDLIFTGSSGTYLDQSDVSKEFKRLLKKVGRLNLRFHDLCHASLSLLLEMGTPVNIVQRHAGHSKAMSTLMSTVMRWRAPRTKPLTR
jgi:integrase